MLHQTLCFIPIEQLSNNEDLSVEQCMFYLSPPRAGLSKFKVVGLIDLLLTFFQIYNSIFFQIIVKSLLCNKNNILSSLKAIMNALSSDMRTEKKKQIQRGGALCSCSAFRHRCLVSKYSVSEEEMLPNSWAIGAKTRGCQISQFQKQICVHSAG